jgi:hypothetical protein
LLPAISKLSEPALKHSSLNYYRSARTNHFEAHCGTSRSDIRKGEEAASRLSCLKDDRSPSPQINKGFSMNQRTTSNVMLFPLGDLVATPGALKVLEKNGVLPLQLVSRHICGDWGDVPPDDAAANTEALRIHSRVLSSYTLADGARIWVITEADRSATTVLLPEEY